MWDPYLIKDIQVLEKIQRRAVRWVFSDYNCQWSSSVSSMLQHLQWPTLAECRLFARLSTFYKIVQNLSAPQMPSYYRIATNRLTHQYHPLHFVIPFTRTNYYINSFYPRTIRDWNNLPISMIELDSIPFREIFYNCIDTTSN